MPSKPEQTEDASEMFNQSRITRVVIAGLRAYQASFSHVFAFLGVRCRHLPTCSEYAVTSVARHGAWTGFWLAASRISRCHPFGSHGWDPPPEVVPRAGWRFWRIGDWAWTKRSAGHSTRWKVSEKPLCASSPASTTSACNVSSDNMK
ncbi:MAG: membrane protein insertion efficiency factor YidD [Alphaproteobacteria bacterium]|nr:membrane protein insertion efficiency factor YidD [Alphaproteobacteria bacterium]